MTCTGGKTLYQTSNIVYSFILMHSSTSMYYRVRGTASTANQATVGSQSPCRAGLASETSLVHPNQKDMLGSWGQVPGGTQALEKCVSLDIILLSREKVITGSTNTVSQHELPFLPNQGEMASQHPGSWPRHQPQDRRGVAGTQSALSGRLGPSRAAPEFRS